ncbi:MAG TPA: hypothetical protein VH092_04040 [Urbifossiella sp.]|jgi:hypothetical protein|nr:hypothetical protein [Urbifossiella sp.]
MFNLFGGSPGFTPEDAARLRRVERKLDLILAHLGVSYTDPDGGLPPEVGELADRGEKIAAIKTYRDRTGARRPPPKATKRPNAAIKTYRDRTGAGLAEAKRAVDEYLADRGA